MKLLLTSKGLNTQKIKQTFQSLLDKPTESIKVQILGVNPGLPDFDMNAYADQDRQELVKLGVKPENILFNELDKEPPTGFNNIDVIIVLGGSGYRYMHHLREHNLHQALKEFVESNKLYMGRSAGALVMGPSVDVGSWGQFTNDIGLEDTSGFGFVDFITVPHIENRENPELAYEFHKETGHKMIYLTDEQAILVIDDLYKII